MTPPPLAHTRTSTTRLHLCLVPVSLTKCMPKLLFVVPPGRRAARIQGAAHWLCFRIVSVPPSAEALAFSKEAAPAADALVGRCILFNWPVFGWCFGKITQCNTNPRISKKMEEGSTTKVNFHIYYEIDEDEVKTVLRADEYDGDVDGSWVLLEPVGEEARLAPPRAQKHDSR